MSFRKVRPGSFFCICNRFRLELGGLVQGAKNVSISVLPLPSDYWTFGAEFVVDVSSNNHSKVNELKSKFTAEVFDWTSLNCWVGGTRHSLIFVCLCRTRAFAASSTPRTARGRSRKRRICGMFRSTSKNPPPFN